MPSSIDRNKLPPAGRPRIILPEWCDHNGHMNMAYYAVVFDQAVEEVFATLGLGEDWRIRSGCSFFSLSAMYHYLREVKAGEQVCMTFRVLDVDAKKVHFFQEMFLVPDDGGEAVRAATAEVLAVHIDMSRRRSAPMAAEVRAVFERARARLAHLPPPPEAGARVGIRRRAG